MSYNPSKTLTGSYALGSSAVSASQPGAGFSGSTSGYPASGSLSGYPATGSVSGYPAGGSVSGYPAGGSVSGYPAGGSVSGYPATGSTSGYPATGSTSGYGQGAGYSGSTSSYPASAVVAKPGGYSGSTSAAPAQGGYTGSTSSYPNAPQGYTSSTSSYPAAPGKLSGSTSQPPPKDHSASTSSYPASNAAPGTYNTQKSYATQASTIGAKSMGGKSMQLSPAARLIRRGPPPRFRPWMIIIVTMSVGTMFIGIVLTIVAHWPGYTAIGSDPLEIVGPTMLAVGAVGFGTCIVLSIVHTRQEKEDFMQKIAASQKSIYASRMTIQSNQSAIGYGNYADVKAPSTSTYGQPQGVMGDGDSGVPSTQTYNSTNMSYEPDSDTSETAGAGKYEVYKIETVPDPNAPVPEGQQAFPREAGVDVEVPQPVRTRTRDTKKQAKADPYGQNNSAYNQSPPQVTGRNSPMAGSGALGVVSSSPMPGAEGTASRRLMQDYSQEGYDVYDPEGKTKPKKEKKKKHHKKAHREAEAMQASAAPGGNGNGGYEGASGQQTPQEPLRIAIRAQPGAQVCITPGFTSQQPDPSQSYAQPQAQMARHESTETEI